MRHLSRARNRDGTAIPGNHLLTFIADSQLPLLLSCNVQQVLEVVLVLLYLALESLVLLQSCGSPRQSVHHLVSSRPSSPLLVSHRFLMFELKVPVAVLNRVLSVIGAFPSIMVALPVAE